MLTIPIELPVLVFFHWPLIDGAKNRSKNCFSNRAGKTLRSFQIRSTWFCTALGTELGMEPGIKPGIRLTRPTGLFKDNSSLILMGLSLFFVTLQLAPFAPFAKPAFAADAECWDSEILHPIEPGNYWTSDLNGGDPYTSLITDEIETISGVSTNTLLYSEGEGSGDKVFLVNNDDGLLFYGMYTPRIDLDDGSHLSNCYTYFFPPMVVLEAEICLDDVIFSSGRVDYYCSGRKVGEARYETEREVVAVQEKTVPFGTYDMIRVKDRLSFFAGNTKEESIGKTWYIPGVGEGKSKADTSQGIMDTRLIDTNLTPVPEPTASACGLTFLATMQTLVFIRKLGFGRSRSCA